MDPLSITAAIVGLVAATARVASLIAGSLSKAPSASDQIRQILSDVSALKSCLGGLQALLIETSLLPSNRQSMIQVDHLVVTLTETILTIAELETLSSSSASSGLSRLLDAKENQEITNVARKLERHKSSLSLILNILQCHSDLEARSAQHSLHVLVEQVLLSNLDISRRLRALEDVNSVQSDLKSCRLDKHQYEETEKDDLNSMQSMDTDTSLPSTVHDALYTSRVYKRTQMYESDVSFSTSTLRPHAFSIFSELTLSDISSLSVIALPLYLADVSNGEYYRFGECLATKKANMPEVGLSKIPTNSSSSSFSSRSWISDVPLEFTWYIPPQSSEQAFSGEILSARPYRLVVLGDINSGKLDLLKQFLKGCPEPDSRTESGCHIWSRLLVDGQPSPLKLLSDEGYISYAVPRDHLSRIGTGVLLVYNIFNHTSFTSIQQYLLDLQRTKPIPKDKSRTVSMPPSAIFRNKSVVLVGYCPTSLGTREVPFEHGREFADRLGCKFQELGDNQGFQVQDAFYDVIRLMREKDKNAQELSRARAKRTIFKSHTHFGLTTTMATSSHFGPG